MTEGHQEGGARGQRIDGLRAEAGMKIKISIIGVGNVGVSCAQRIAEKDYADLVLVDVNEGLAQGKALDILESAPVIGFDSQIIGTNSYEETANSNLVIITAGIARPVGITRREDMIAGNRKILEQVVPQVIAYSPDCIIIISTNPVEPMTHLALNLSKFSRNRIIGLSGVTDSTRLRYFIAAKLRVSVRDVSACIIGQHGNAMVVLPRLTTVAGVSITKIMPREDIQGLIQRTIKGGWEINQLIKENRWSVYTPSASLVQMAETIIFNKKQILTCATFLQGEYGIHDTVMGVPVKLGRAGVEEVIELDLTPEEKTALLNSARIVQDATAVMAL